MPQCYFNLAGEKNERLKLPGGGIILVPFEGVIHPGLDQMPSGCVPLQHLLNIEIGSLHPGVADPLLPCGGSILYDIDESDLMSWLGRERTLSAGCLHVSILCEKCEGVSSGHKKAWRVSPGFVHVYIWVNSGSSKDVSSSASAFIILQINKGFSNSCSYHSIGLS